MKLPFEMTGEVVHGLSVGSTYDSPTANIIPEEDVSHLLFGVYFSVMTIDGIKHPAITNLGVRPTFSDEGRVNAETYVYDLKDDIYGKRVRLELLKFHRSERKFSSADELFAAIHKDLREGARFHCLAYPAKDPAV